MTNDQIMNEIEKDYSSIDGWTFYREHGFDQFKKDEISICVLVEEEDSELNVQVFDPDDSILFCDSFPLSQINTATVLNEVRKVIQRADDLYKAFKNIKPIQ
jgi:hypothetical protein